MLLALAFATLSTDLNVYAAASLRESFTTIARSFEAKNPGVKVRLAFAGSQQIAAQINNGAPADVFASAAPKPLDSIEQEPGSRRLFANNSLVIIVPPESKLKTYLELPAAKRIVIAAKDVPVGGYTLQMFDKVGAAWKTAVLKNVVSHEQDVRAVLAKVQLKEADAGVVYETDAKAAGNKVRAIRIPESKNVIAQYLIAIPKSSTNKSTAKKFIAFVLSPESQGVLRSRGFGPAN